MNKKPLTSSENSEHCLTCKVYYEDTDCGGVVYHANYLKYMERARTEMLNTRGPSIVEWAKKGYTFVVYHLEIAYRLPARLGDELTVLSRVRPTSPYRVTFDQRIEYSGQESKSLVKAEVELVCIDREGNLQAFPEIKW